VSVVVRRGLSRFLTRDSGRQTRHSFSFGQFYDPDRISFGPLVALNDELLGRDAGYPEHEHADLVIVTWVVTGCLEHTDGSRATLQRAGQLAVTTTGTAFAHSERAAGEVTRFVQMWLTPDTPGGDRGREVSTPDLSAPGWVTVADDDGGTGHVALGIAGARLEIAELSAGETVALPAESRAYVFVVSGALARSSLAEPLAAGDAFEITDHAGRDLGITAAVPTQLLAWSFSGPG
jgi:quercetin 2,3-dioxygenase